MSAAAPSGIAGIDVAAATAAIEQAGGLSTVMQDETSQMTGTATTPQGQQGTTATGEAGQVRDPVTGRWVSPGQEVTQQTPPEQVVQPQATTPDAFTAVDPSSLAPELQSIYKGMQADYTRKTQEIAEQRRLFDQLGGQEQMTEAARLYQSLQNPANWPQLYNELKDGMEQLGLTPQEAHVAATQEVQRQQTAVPPVQAGNEQVDWNDPDLAPLKAMFDSLDNKITGMTNTFEAQREAEKQERLQRAIVGEMQRQENMIRQMNPGYTDDDLNSIYELSSYHQGNLLESQKRYEEIVQSRLERFLAQKATAVGTPGLAPVSGGALQSSQPVQYKSLDEAHVAAMESLRQMEALEQ